MKHGKLRTILPVVILFFIGAAFVIGMVILFDKSPMLRTMFSGDSKETESKGKGKI